ncbi:MAG: bifunctional adenosylcobinamide kinase/adenosylcobinamide-phosphate guanylyltransferase [bacterium]
MEGRIIFVFGGIKSGKSDFVVNFALKVKKSVTFIATAEPIDEEMKEKIKLHQQSRPKKWITIEESNDIGSALDKVESEVIIIECLSTYISNFMIKGKDPLWEMKHLLNKISKSNKRIFIISNDVGNCLIPDNKLGRDFIDIMGKINQEIVKLAHEVYYLRAGISDRLK